MTYELTNEEKIDIINQHIRNLGFSKYNLETTLLSENAVATPDSAKVNSLTQQISDVDLKISALESEISTLSA